MSQLVTNTVPSVVENVISKNKILVENKSEQSSEGNTVEKGGAQRKSNIMEIFGLRKSNKPPVPPKATKKSETIIKKKTEVEDVPKFTSEKLDTEEILDDVQIKKVDKTESSNITANQKEEMPELECLPLPQIIAKVHSSSENEIPKQTSTEPKVDATVIQENPTRLQVELSCLTNATLPTPVTTSRKDTRTLSHTSLSRRSSASSSTSRSSLGLLAAPSSSSMCHLTELSQPTTVHLQSTLARLRRLNADTARVQQHLKDLRNRPTLAWAKKSSSDTRINRSSKSTGSKSLASTIRISSLSATTDKSGLFERPVYEKLADRLFETLESKLTVKNAPEQLMLPMESDYYRAAYAGLARIWGQPYTKCTLELHQHLAAELGLLAETFVMDSTRGMSLDALQQDQQLESAVNLTA